MSSMTSTHSSWLDTGFQTRLLPLQAMKEATCDPNARGIAKTKSHELIALQLILFPWTSDPPFCLPPTTCQATRCDLSYPDKTSGSRRSPTHLHTHSFPARTLPCHSRHSCHCPPRWAAQEELGPSSSGFPPCLALWSLGSPSPSRETF